MSTPSKHMAQADLIATRLRTAPATGELPTPLNITTVDVLVYKQKAIATKITAALDRDTGAAIVITWEGFTTLDPLSSHPRLAHRYNVCIWSRPVIDKDAFPADQILESIIARLWRWVPGGGHCFGASEIRDGGLVPDPKFLKIDCEVVFPIYH